MTDRTYEQLYSDARRQRQEWLDAGESPSGDAFVVTPHEHFLILDRRPPCYELSSSRHRMCGLLITVLPVNGSTVTEDRK